MSKKIFTEEEVAILRQNPYVAAVTPKRIHYSTEFKQLFWKEYNETGSPTGIMQKYGFCPEILGAFRIHQLPGDIRKEIAKGATCYADVRNDDSTIGNNGKSGMKNTAELKLLKEIRKLQEENEYLKEKLAFLKKIISARTGKVPEV